MAGDIAQLKANAVRPQNALAWRAHLTALETGTDEILGHGFGRDALFPDYTYLKGDLHRAYSDKIAGYERSFMFLNLKNDAHPGVLIVFDRVAASNKSFRKVWLLHGLQELDVNGNRIVFRNTRPRYNGKLIVDTLLPATNDTLITKIGGPGKEFWVAGKNYDAFLKPGTINEGSGWRVEVSPRQPHETDFFLHVLQATDANPDVAALLPVAIRASTHEGLKIADRAVLFGKGRDRLAGPVGFAFDGRGDFRSWSPT